MGSGRRSLDRKDKKNSFDDYYSSSRNNNIEENNDLSNNNENNNLDDNYERNINFAESNFWDEDEEEFNYGKLIVIIPIIVIAIIVGVLVYKFVINKPVEEQPKEENTVVQESATMIETVSGYKVLGKIVISNLGIEQYILDSIESNALQSAMLNTCNEMLDETKRANATLEAQSQDTKIIKRNSEIVSTISALNYIKK